MKNPRSAQSIQAAIQKRCAIRFVNHNWDIASLDIVRLSMLELERGLDRLTQARGRDWIRANLGGARISLGCDHSILGNQFVMKKIFNNRSHAVGDRVYLAENFSGRAWHKKPRAKADLWILHELGHVWDNRSAFGLGSTIGGGYSDQLLKFVGGKVKSFPLLRFIDNSLEIKPEYAFSRSGNLAYGNNSPADYFANVFVSAIALPDTPGVPGAAVGWMIDLIQRTTPLPPGGA
jgi:hypothetical protein